MWRLFDGEGAAWAVHRRRSRGSCAATGQLVVVVWFIGQLLRGGTRSGVLAVRRSRSSLGNDELRHYVQDRLGEMIAHPDGELVPGPEVRWVGLRHGRRRDRRWATSWSPEQISDRLWIDFLPIVSPCEFLTRRSARRSMCKVEVRSNTSLRRVCEPGERCGARRLHHRSRRDNSRG